MTEKRCSPDSRPADGLPRPDAGTDPAPKSGSPVDGLPRPDAGTDPAPKRDRQADGLPRPDAGTDPAPKSDSAADGLPWPDAGTDPDPKNDKCYVVDDAEGFVGAFLSPTEAVCRMQLYSRHGVPFLITEYALKPGAQTAVLYTIPYKGGATAFASNDPEEARWAQAALVRVGLADDNDIGYWEAALGEINGAAKRRLDRQVAPYDKKGAQEAVDRFMTMCAGPQSPANTLPLDAPEKIDILKGVVPCALQKAAGPL